MATQVSQIEQEIHDEIESAFAAGRPVSESSLIETIMARHPDLSADDWERLGSYFLKHAERLRSSLHSV